MNYPPITMNNVFDDFDPIPTYDTYSLASLTMTANSTASPNAGAGAGDTVDAAVDCGTVDDSSSTANVAFGLYSPEIGTSMTYEGSESTGSISSILSKYCTPRSLSQLLSIELEIDDVPLSFKPNIWSPNYRSCFPTSLNLDNELTTRINNFHFKDAGNNQVVPSEPLSPLSSCLSPPNKVGNYDISGAINNNSRNEHLNYSVPPAPVPSPISPAPLPPAAVASPLRSQPSFLTFRSYKGTIFTVPKNSKFFVIKSYNILDVNASFTNNIWTSTELGNRRLDKAYQELQVTGNPDYDGKIFLFFLVNSLGKFCGIAEMKDCIDYTKTSEIWVEQTRWKGIFPVEWLLIKDVPNRFFQHLKVPSNENKPVTNSRDTQEIPFDIGISMLKIISSFRTND